MKRAIAVILFILYVIPAIGINISVHYCGGEVASVSFTSNKADRCVCGSKKMKKDCCKDKQLSFKIKSDQQKIVAVTLAFFKTFTALKETIPTYTFSFSPVATDNILYNDYHPPDKIKQPLYILHRVFRI